MAQYPTPLKYIPARWSLDIEETGDEPVSASEAKSQLRISFTDDDTIIGTYITAARQAIESMTNRAIITQTRTLTMSEFPAGDKQFFELPGGNIMSVSSIAYTDESGDPQTFTAYALDNGTSSGTARIHLSNGSEWPSVYDQGLPVTVTYVAGYDASASPAVNCPERLKVAIKMVVADLYERREANVEKVAKNPMLEALIAPARIWRAV